MAQLKNSRLSTVGERLPAPRAALIRVFVLLISLLVPLLSMIPTWNGYREERPPGKVFIGFRYLADDQYTYASFIGQAADEGRLFMENRFTTEPQKGRFLLLYMWITGQICRVTGLGIPAAWELMRLVTGVAFMLAAWSFISLLFQNPGSRTLAYLLVAFSGGIGWALYLITGEPGPGLTPAYLKDAFNYQWNWSTFGSMLMPLWVAPAAIFLLCARLLAQEGKSLAIMRPLLGFILPPLIWFMHPYTGIAAYFAFGLFPFVPVASALWRTEAIDWKRFRGNLAKVFPALLSFVIVASYLLWAQQDEVYAINGRGIFTWNPTYSVFLYPFAYGLLLPLSMYGLRWGGSLPAGARDIMIAWLTSSVLLSVNPFFSGVKFQYLVHLPLALFAAYGVVELRRRFEYARTLSTGVGALVLGALLFLNTPLILVKDLPSTSDNPLIYVSTAEIDAMKFLNSQPPGNVLCGAKAGNRIPWLAAKKVYVGHWFLTIKHIEKQAEIAAFFDPRVHADQKRAWLYEHGIRYVYYGPDERAMGGVDPGLRLRTVYENGRVTIYAVP